MTDTTFGPEIAVNGKRPDWLSKDTYFRWYGGSMTDVWWDRNARDGINVHCFYWGEGCPVSIRLPADHFAYKALDAGFEPWGGGDAAPADWDGGPVLLRGGSVVRPGEGDNALVWSHPHMSVGHEEIAGDIIGYHKRTPTAATPAGTVQIARMTEAEADALLKRFDYGLLDILKHLGLLKPETTAERFTRETGHEVTPAVEAALAWERGK